MCNVALDVNYAILSLCKAGYLIRIVALGVGIPLALAGLCFVGIAAGVLGCVAIRRKKGKINGKI